MRTHFHRLQHMGPAAFYILRTGLQAAVFLLSVAAGLLWQAGTLRVGTVTAYFHAVALNRAALTVLFVCVIAAAFAEEHGG